MCRTFVADGCTPICVVCRALCVVCTPQRVMCAYKWSTHRWRLWRHRYSLCRHQWLLSLKKFLSTQQSVVPEQCPRFSNFLAYSKFGIGHEIDINARRSLFTSMSSIQLYIDTVQKVSGRKKELLVDWGVPSSPPVPEGKANFSYYPEGRANSSYYPESAQYHYRHQS